MRAGHERTCRILATPKSIVERGTQDSGHKVREVRSALVKLKVAHDAMVGEIFCDPGFGDTEVISKARLDGLRAPSAGGAAQETANSDAQSLARLDIIVGGKVGIAEQQHPWTNGRAISFAEFQRGARQQTPKLHF